MKQTKFNNFNSIIRNKINRNKVKLRMRVHKMFGRYSININKLLGNRIIYK